MSDWSRADRSSTCKIWLSQTNFKREIGGVSNATPYVLRLLPTAVIGVIYRDDQYTHGEQAMVDEAQWIGRGFLLRQGRDGPGCSTLYGS
jgi:hypothetical protein